MLNENNIKFCPFLSTAEKRVPCDINCNLYRDNPAGTIPSKDCVFATISKQLDDIDNTVFNLK